MSIKFNGKDIVPRFNGKDVSRVMFNGKQIYPNNVMQLVDLGLPSGYLWSNINLGAKDITDVGYYCQWGDTIGYLSSQIGVDKEKTFNNSTYKYSVNGSNEEFSKYNDTDNIIYLEDVDDIAYNILGSNYHIPSREDFTELYNNTTRSLENIGNINVVKFTSKNNENYIYVPLGGIAYNVIEDTNYFYLMTNYRHTYNIFACYAFYGNATELIFDNYPRACGYNVRPIYKPN